MIKTPKKKRSSVKSRIRHFFLDNVGIVVSRKQIQETARNPETNVIPENWHQRLSELRIDEGYDILSWRDREYLNLGQYLLENAKPTRRPRPRKYLTKKQKEALFKRDNQQCQWPDCKLSLNDIDPIGGGTVILTADHKSPHSLSDNIWTGTLDDWQTSCMRHQQKKKNFIDDRTGKKNIREIVRAASESVKRQIYEDLKAYFETKSSKN